MIFNAKRKDKAVPIDKPLPAGVTFETVSPVSAGKRYPVQLSVLPGYRMSLSAGFIKLHKLEAKTLIRFSICDDPPTLAFTVSDQTGTSADDSCFGLYRNSADIRSASRAVVPRSLFGRSAHLESIRREAVRRQHPVHLPIYHDETRDLFHVELRAVMERLWRSGEPVPVGYAVYRYIDGPDIVYIGQGEISERLREPRRRHWLFDYVEFTLVRTKTDGTALEHSLLEEHRDLFGRLPRYNSKRGSEQKH